jgi:uncharacterized protein with PhoU and TrkA domain
MKNDNQAIVFYCTKCGKIIMAMVNNSEHLKDSADEIADLIKQGHQMNIISKNKAIMSKWCNCKKED